jgi:NitT/TauT family transport system substrate-binding protein
MSKRITFIIIVGALAVLVALGIYLYIKPASEKVALTTVTIHQAAKTLLYLPLYVAVEEGYLKKEGIEARIVTAGGDSQAFAALASGQAQFAQGDPTFVAISHERGGPGIVIAGVLDRVAFWGVTFDKLLKPFSDPKQFRGLTVVTYPEPNTAYVVQKGLLSKAGLRLGRDAFITQATFGTELGPLEAGKAQIAMSIEPTVSQAVARGARIVFSYPDAWGPFLLTGVMTTREFAAKNPQIVQGLVNAYERALRLIHENPAAAVGVGQKYFPEVGAEVVGDAVKRMTSEKVFPEHAIINLESWRSTLRLRVEVGDLKENQHDSLVENSYAKTAQGR